MKIGRRKSPKSCSFLVDLDEGDDDGSRPLLLTLFYVQKVAQMAQNGLASFSPNSQLPTRLRCLSSRLPRSLVSPPSNYLQLPFPAPHRVTQIPRRRRSIDQPSLLFCLFLILSSRLSLDAVAGIHG